MNTLCFAALLLFSLHASVRPFSQYYTRLRRFDLFGPHVLFPVAFAAIYGAGIPQLTSQEKEIPTGYFLFYFVALAAYFLGLILSRAFRAKIVTTSKRMAQIEDITIYLLLAAFIAVSIFVLAKAGNPLFSSDMNSARTDIVKIVGGWMYYLYRTVAIIFTIYAAHYFCRNNRTTIGITAFSFVTLICCFLIISSGYRGQILTALLTLLILYHYKVRIISVKKFLVACLLLLCAFSAFGAIRTLGSAEWTAIWDRLFLELQTPAMSVHRIAESIPSRYDYFGFGILIYPIMSLLPGEQLAYGLILKEMLGLTFEGGGFVPSLVGGFYLIHGFTSVYIGMLCYGLVYGYMYDRMIATRSHYLTLLYAYSSVYFLNTIRGGFFQEVIPLWFIAIISSFYALFEKSRKVQAHAIYNT